MRSNWLMTVLNYAFCVYFLFDGNAVAAVICASAGGFLLGVTLIARVLDE